MQKKRPTDGLVKPTDGQSMHFHSLFSCALGSAGQAARCMYIYFHVLSLFTTSLVKCALACLQAHKIVSHLTAREKRREPKRHNIKMEIWRRSISMRFALPWLESKGKRNFLSRGSFCLILRLLACSLVSLLRLALDRTQQYNHLVSRVFSSSSSSTA